MTNPDLRGRTPSPAPPQAREDAQPVAWTGSGSLARIKGRAGNFQGYIYGTPDAAHPIALYTHPAPDALRVAVEALTALAGKEGDAGEKVYVPCAWKPFREVARQALAALQQEGRE